MAERLRLGLIGAGHLGQYISPAIRETGDFEMVAAADINDGAREAATAEYGYLRAYRDYRDMLGREQLDAVIVATPHHLLGECSLAVIEAGVHVFVEKPMALSAAEASRVVGAARAADVRLMVGYCMRFAAVRRRMKDLVERGAIGDLVTVVGGKGGGPLPVERWPWMGDVGRGGGQMMYLGSHLIDQVLWVANSRVKRVYAEMTLRRGDLTDETTTLIIGFENGVRAELLVSQGMWASFDYVEVMGSGGYIRAEWSPANRLQVRSSAMQAYEHPTTILVCNEPEKGMYVEELHEFASAIRENRDPAVTGEDGFEVLRVIGAAFESARTEQVVTL